MHARPHNFFIIFFRVKTVGSGGEARRFTQM
jgi:hypothetical protein